jgi:hypothetical protein
MFAYRRRRNRRANLAYIQQVQPGTGGVYNGAGGPPPFTPQYPPPAHNGLNYPYNYDPSSGFAPVRGLFLFTLPLLTFVLVPVPMPMPFCCRIHFHSFLSAL